MHYITHEVGLATLLVLYLSGGGKEQRPTGILAQPNLSPQTLEAYGIGVM